MVVEAGFEELTGAADAGLDGSDGGGLDLGGLGVGEVFEGHESEGAFLFSGELMKSLVKHSQAVSVFGFRGVGVLLGKFSQESRALLLERIERAAAGDHEQPGGESTAGGIEILEAPKGFHEDDLRDVFGVASFVIEKGGNHTEQAILVMKNEMLKGVDLPVHDAADDFEFVGFVHSLFPDYTDYTGEGGNGSIFPSGTQKGAATPLMGLCYGEVLREQAAAPFKKYWNALFEKTAAVWHPKDPAACAAWLSGFPEEAQLAANYFIERADHEPGTFLGDKTEVRANPDTQIAQETPPSQPLPYPERLPATAPPPGAAEKD